MQYMKYLTLLSTYWIYFSLIVIALLQSNYKCQAQELRIPFSDFKSKINDFSSANGSDLLSIKELPQGYEAVLKLQNARLLMIKIETLASCGRLAGLAESYLFEGFESKYLQTDLISYLQVQHIESSFCITLSVDSKEDKKQMENILGLTKLLSLLPPEVVWPDLIPVPLRIYSSPIQISFNPSDVEGFIHEVHIVVPRNLEVIQTLKKFSMNYENQDDFIALPNLILVYEGGTFSRLFLEKTDETPIKFTYFIKYE